MSPSLRPAARRTGRTRPPPTGSDSMARRSVARDRLRGGADPRPPPFATGSTAPTRKDTRSRDSGSRELTVSSEVVQGQERELGARGRLHPPDDEPDRHRVLLARKRGVRRLGDIGTPRDPVRDRGPGGLRDRLDQAAHRAMLTNGDGEADAHLAADPDDLRGIEATVGPHRELPARAR